MNDPNYLSINNNENEVASEVHSRLSGEQGAELLEKLISEAKQEKDFFKRVNKLDILNKLKSWLKDFWKWTKSTMAPWTDSEVAKILLEDFIRMPLMDLVKGTKLSDSGIEITFEEQSIIAEAKENGTYLKAPNGKDSNLNPKQWVQVRTQAFKKWFGDWEKSARIEKLRNSKSVEITGNEITPDEDLKQYKKNALEYGKTLRSEYINKDTGIVVNLGNNGIKEVLHHDYKNIEQLQSVAAIPNIIENSIYIDTVENENLDKKPNIKSYDYYVCGLKIDRVDYTVKVVIANDRDGVRYYDHSLTQIEKGKLLDEVNGITNPARQKESSLSGIKDKRLVSILQTNASKVVDENGEPLVVYYAASEEYEGDFTIFNTELKGAERGFYFSNKQTVEERI